jgi:hypothetical protein
MAWMGKTTRSTVFSTLRLWGTITYEEGSLHDYPSTTKAWQGMIRSIHFFNQQRPPKALEYQTPAAVCYSKEKSSALASLISLSYFSPFLCPGFGVDGPPGLAG